MIQGLPSSLLTQLSNCIAAQLGLHFPEMRWRDLERGLVSAASTLGFPDALSCAQSLLTAPLTRSQIEELSIHLTVGETYFFREKPVFDALREHVLPELLHTRRGSMRQLRVWSAGCCTGEEAYSTAILLRQLIPDWKEWLLTILATDINPQFLRKAMAGVYGEWSFRDVPPKFKQHYFTQTLPGRYQLIPSIKQQVKFAYLNLVEDSYPATRNNTTGMDLIFCRNVLMYFSREQAKKVVRKLYNSLVDGGWLIVSSGEVSHLPFSEFETAFDTVDFAGAILYQKKSDPPSAIETSSEKRPEKIPSQIAPQAFHHWRASLREVARHSYLLRSEGHSSRKGAIPCPSTMDALGIEPLSPNSSSQALYDQGRYAEAEEELRKVMAEGPVEANGLMLLARICANQGRLDEALEWCRRSIAADRLNVSSYYLYATIQEERGEIEDAMRSLKRTLYLHPEFVFGHFALGHLMRRQGKMKESDKHFANMFELVGVYQQEEILPESDGLTAGRLIDMMRSISPTDSLPQKVR